MEKSSYDSLVQLGTPKLGVDIFLSTGICTLGPSPISTLPRLKIWSVEKMKHTPTSVRAHPTDFIYKKPVLTLTITFPFQPHTLYRKETNYVTRQNCTRSSFFGSTKDRRNYCITIIKDTASSNTTNSWVFQDSRNVINK
jgi:hypothetical protein